MIHTYIILLTHKITKTTAIKNEHYEKMAVMDIL
jgi:hypothetical protein